MNNLSSSPFVMDCTFSDNIASGNADSAGGGMSNFLEQGSGVISNPTVTDCVFSGNSAVYGGGMENEYRDPTVMDCLFSGNTADDGGGIDNYMSNPILTNSIFWGNMAISDGNEIYNDSSTPVISYSDIAGSFIGGVTWDSSLGTDGGGNVDADPLFVEIPDDGGDGWGDINDDYGDLKLKGGSPCIDAANGDAAPNTDSLGNPRIDDPLMSNTGVGNPDYVDIGAYESQNPCMGRDKADFDCNGIVNMADFVYFASHWLQ
jgi:hypothetical protein